MMDLDLPFSTTELHVWSTWDKFLWHMGCNTSDSRKAFTTIICFLIIILIIFMVYIMNRFVKAEQNVKSEQKHMYNITIFYFVLNFIFYFSVILMMLNHCYFEIFLIHWILWIIKLICYVGSIQVFIGILFYRLYLLFRNQEYSLSKCTISMFISLNIFAVINLLFMIIVDAVYDGHMLFFIANYIGNVVIFCVIIWIPGLFIHKLYKVAKMQQSINAKQETVNADNALLAQIAKYTILAVISLFGTLLSVISVFLLALGDSSHDWFWWKRIGTLVSVIDFATNSLCLVLGYDYAANIYGKLCGSLDLQCRILCAGCVASGLGKTVNSVSVTSTAKI
eukprot:35994_1